nr:uncharacterized protein LOC117229298 [Megalopta genalis]XP_033341601.1 uncharacterized protein LOC117229298 [Megalopta genalis]XP_033341602.1 uncharacterized protein LOC117229298 [Megalopta genalis]XP_033341603.1 uncharacterized protein LOC117229298 [Megalopta genalis]XP_033341604.1 uncharacterized protein LOC117229298 [Megalopta genalis]
MAQTILPKLASKPIITSAMCPTDFSTTTPLSDVLNSEPVKRLLNQPNIIVRAIPLNIQTTPNSYNNVTNKVKMTHINVKESKTKLNTTILPENIKEKNADDENLLPSKINGKSEIMLVPIKSERKPCGHYEPCENIVCDVAVQQYMDRDGSSPLLATNIEEDEINAPVTKHCKNEKCDALSIDHDRCRRAVVRLYRCNRSKACDICGTELQTRRCRIHHKNCTRTNEYRHNESNRAEILKVRMREREIQMIEASKLSRKDYTDPVAALETLKRNEEIIIIPKSVPVRQPTTSTVPVTAPQHSPHINNVNNIFGKLLPNIPFVLPQQSLVVGKSQCSNENGITAAMQVAMPDATNQPFIPSTNSVPLARNQYVTFATQHSSQPLTLNDILFTQSHVMSTPIQSKPVLTPIRVVPITNLITQPSLLHQKQGIPRYCIMADSPIPIPLTIGNSQSSKSVAVSLTVTNQQPVQQTTAPLTITNSLPIPSLIPITTAKPQPTQQPIAPLTVPKPTLVPRAITKIEIPNESNISFKKRKPISKKKRKHKKKEFKCKYCLKRFSTDWYFKLHVAMHTGESRYSCKVCKESFANNIELRNHMVLNHKKNKLPEVQALIKKKRSLQQTFQCLDCPTNCPTMRDLKYHRQLKHGRVACALCHAEVMQEELVKHFASVHNRTGKILDRMDAAMENGDVSDEDFDTKDFVKIDTNSLPVKTKIENDSKTNGHNSNYDEITVENIKIELDDFNET